MLTTFTMKNQVRMNNKGTLNLLKEEEDLQRILRMYLSSAAHQHPIEKKIRYRPRILEKLIILKVAISEVETKKIMTNKKWMMILRRRFKITVLKIEMLIKTTLLLTFKMIEGNKYTVIWTNFSKTDLTTS